MAEGPAETNCDIDEPYETVVYRNSTIIYPAELASPVPHSASSLATRTPRPRESVLNEFDPIARDDRKFSWSRLEREWQVLVNPQMITCEVPDPPQGERSESPPPPIPPRRDRGHHSYDTVSFEDNLPQILPRVPSESSPDARTVIIKNLKTARAILNKVTRPSVKAPQGASTQQGGLLRWSVSGRIQTYHTDLMDGYLCYKDLKNDTLKLSEPLNKIVGIGVTSDEKTQSEGEIYWFELASIQDKRRAVVLGAASAVERSCWMTSILRHVALALNDLPLGSFERAGKVYIKEGISGDWQTAWIVLQGRKLWRQTILPNGQQGDAETPQCEDLRKVRSISVSQMGDEGSCYLALEAGPIIVVDWQEHSLYIQADLKRETETWNRTLRSQALYSGPSLEDQQLTADDVPVLVERCIRFISSHGILSEGIYRKSGVNSKIQRLLEQLKFDAWNVRMSTEDYSEHDVSNVLKRFFRTLPEPLLTNEHYSHWINACSVVERDERLEVLTVLLRALPRVNYQTLRRLLGHLHAVHDQCEKNLMPVGNLASLLGPNLMTVESGRDMASSFTHTGAETDVLLQLIQNYPWLFGVDPDALQQERELAKAMERIQCAVIPRKVEGGNMIVWVHYGEDLSNEVSLTVWPSRTIQEVIAEVAERIVHSDNSHQRKSYVLMEFICNGSMKRPLAFGDPVLPVILSWLDWPEEDRKNNRLVFHQDDTFVNIVQQVVTPRSMFVEVRYADPKSKQFRKCPFEFCQARLTLLKDCKNHTVQGRYDLENVTWYLGGDPRRSFPTKWVISFIEKGVSLKRSKESPYLGHSISFANEAEYQQFLMALVATQFSEGLRNFVLRL